LSNSGSAVSATNAVNVNEYVHEIKEGQIKNYMWDGVSSWVRQGSSDGLKPSPYDTVATTYSGAVLPYIEKYKMGGMSGTVIFTLTYTYGASSNVTSVVRT
jgi:hypothetical protein